MPVHIYGRVCAMAPIMAIAEAHDLYVIEDCSEAHGATYLGRPVGAIGDVGCFSLFRNKIVHAEEGGVITTNNEALALRMQDMKNMAFGSQHNYLHNGLGFNYRMTNGQAELALESLLQVGDNLKKRWEIAERYASWLPDRSPLRPNGSVLWMYDFFCGEEHQEEIVRHFFKPMSMQPIIDRECINSKAFYFSKRGVYLPVREDMDEEYVDLICKAVVQIVKG